LEDDLPLEKQTRKGWFLDNTSAWGQATTEKGGGGGNITELPGLSRMLLYLYSYYARY
jgi:hypothetical protein